LQINYIKKNELPVFKYLKVDAQYYHTANIHKITDKKSPFMGYLNSNASRFIKTKLKDLVIM